MTCFDCKVCFGSKFTSSAEGRRFNWLIYDSMTSLFARGRFSKSRGLSASVSFLLSFPFPFHLFYSRHSSPCNSLLPNCTETLATQARALLVLLFTVDVPDESLPFARLDLARALVEIRTNLQTVATLYSCLTHWQSNQARATSNSDRTKTYTIEPLTFAILPPLIFKEDVFHDPRDN